MKKPIEPGSQDELRPEYDFGSMKGGVRGKYYELYREGRNVLDTKSRSLHSAPARLASESEKTRGRSGRDDKLG